LTAGLVRPGRKFPRNASEDVPQRAPAGEGVNYEEVHEMHYLQREGDAAPVLKPYVIK
jgi:hypothetical protein